MAERQLDRRLAAERGPAGQHLVQHHADAVDVGRRAHAVTARLLGRHVPRRPDDRRRERIAAAVREPRDAEVPHLDRAMAGDQDVRRLDVAVDDPVGVGVGERPAELLGDIACVPRRERTAT